MKKFSEKLERVANNLEHHLNQWFTIQVLDDEWPWENTLWHGPKIRWAHIQKYAHEKAHILHLVIMPDINYAAPIFGFDLIELNGNYTGLFLDYTPTCNTPIPASTHQFSDPRPVPEWGDFFSEHFVCCRPTESEVGIALESLPQYLEILNRVERDESLAKLNKACQRRYVLGQRKNPQTRRMITAHYNQDMADRFIDGVLFPMDGLDENN